MKKIVITLLLTLVFFASPVYAASIGLDVDGTLHEFSGEIVNLNGSTLAPMRSLYETLGGNVGWDASSKTAIIKIDKKIIKIPTNSTVAFVSDAETAMNAASCIINGRIYAPIRFAGEVLGYTVDWQSGTVFFTSPEEPEIVFDPESVPLDAEELYIMGDPYIPRETMREWFEENIPDYVEIVDCYYDIADIYGVRADLAIAQAIWETGYFSYSGQVEAWQNNYCGLYATGAPLTGLESIYGADSSRVRVEEGVCGAIFIDMETGVEAHIQHLYAYATSDPLPEGVTILDPRFNLLSARQRGSSPCMAWLGAFNNPTGIGWAYPGDGYGYRIVDQVYTKPVYGLPR